MSTANAMSMMMEQSKQPTPVVGMGCTILMYTDRHAATIIEVANLKTVVIQADIAKRTDKNGMSDYQFYEYTSDPNAHKRTFTLRKNGRWCEKGEPMSMSGIALGHRSTYHDYSF